MILQEGRIGDANLIFPHITTLRTQVLLAHPVTKVRALLRGFDIGNGWGDRNLRTMSVRLEVGYGDAANQVEVSAAFQLQDSDPTGEPMQVEVWFTLIGE